MDPTDGHLHEGTIRMVDADHVESTQCHTVAAGYSDDATARTHHRSTTIVRVR
jgi:hypothetical protein